MITFSIILILSCTPRAYSESTTLPNITPKISDEAELPILRGVSAPSGLIVDNPDEIISLADTMASNAEIAALENDYPRAHKLFTIALELITTFGDDAKFDSLTAHDSLFNRIAEFYVDLLPVSYLDSVPQSIGHLVSRYQVNELINNMDSGLVESSKFPTDCGDGTIYNIPIVYNRRVHQAIKALTTPQREQTMNRLMTRAHFYRPFMVEMFTKAGLPSDLTYLPLLESAFNPKAYSPAHASGLWQFIPSTGSMYKMRDNYWVDERRDPIKATAAAIAYLTRLHRMFSDWHLALASYNTGEGRVSRHIAKTGAKNYWQLDLSRETMNYVPLFIAYQVIGKNPQCFGYKVDTTVVPFNFDTVKVSDCIDLQKIADVVSISFDSLKTINPHIKHWCTPPNMNDVNLYLPYGKGSKFKTFYASLTDKEKIIWHRYLVKNGDSLDKIAKRFNVSEELLASSNKMSGSSLAVGRYIVIPIPASEKIPAEESDVETFSADTLSGSMQAPQYTTVKQSVTKTVKKVHTIKRGETLSSIARKYSVSVKDLAQWNKISTSKTISTGKHLKIFKMEKTTVTVKKKVSGSSSVSKTAIISNAERQYYTVLDGEGIQTVAEKIGVTSAQLIEWNNLEASNPVLQPQQKLLFYKSAIKSMPKVETPDPKNQEKDDTIPTSSRKPETYIATSGETLFSISQKLNVSLKNLCEWNGKDINNPSLLVDEKIQYFTSETSTLVKQERDSLKSVLQTKETEQSKSNQSYQETKVTQNVRTKEKKSYIVRPGQSMQQIAQKLNVSMKDLCVWNNRSSKKPMVYSNEKLIYYVYVTKKGTAKEVSVVKEKTSSQPKSNKRNYTVSAGETLSSIADKLGVSINELCEWNNRSESNPTVYTNELLTYYGKEVSSNSSKDNDSPKPNLKKNTYIVASGESMGQVAEKLNCTISQICEWNDKNPKNPMIYSGEKLVYYSDKPAISSSKSSSSSTTLYTVKKGESIYSIARAHNISVAKFLEINNMETERSLQTNEKINVPSQPKSKSNTSSKQTSHVVKKGETLWSISSKYGVSVASISKANGLSENASIQIGKTLKIPSKE